MPNKNAPAGSRYSGWYMDKVNNVLEWYSNGTKVGQASGSTVTMAGNVTNSGTFTSTGALVGSSTVTSTGVFTASAEARIAEGFNLRIGTISAFATTEPTNAIVMKVGTNPVGAITTSGGIFVTTGGATISKIVAGGTVSQIEA